MRTPKSSALAAHNLTLYRWRSGETFAVVWCRRADRDWLVERMAVVGDLPIDRVGDYPLSSVKNERLRTGWARASAKSGAVLALGMSAL